MKVRNHIISVIKAALLASSLSLLAAPASATGWFSPAWGGYSPSYQGGSIYQNTFNWNWGYNGNNWGQGNKHKPGGRKDKRNCFGHYGYCGCSVSPS